eukprot:SRR837773.15096.p2 GENE.SRR837773.15096~~SRR837773.15096.p2  ORF type:complete len:102 (+),score=20.80 SRR837773.15096:47-307(+)
MCGTSPCDFCCESSEVKSTGGICPVITCDDALGRLGLDIETSWPSGSTNEDTIWYNALAMLVLLVAFRLLGMLVLLLSYRRAAKRG